VDYFNLLNLQKTPLQKTSSVLETGRQKVQKTHGFLQYTNMNKDMAGSKT